MCRPFDKRLVFVSAAVFASWMVGCAAIAPEDSPPVSEQPADTITPAPVASAEPSPVASPTPQVDPWETAMSRATTAANLAQAAQSNDDWALVGRRWQEAIALLESVPADHPQHGQAQSKITEYRANLAIAEQRADRPIPEAPLPTSRPSVAAESPTESENGGSTVATATDETSPLFALANHLQQNGATMYGAYWCGYCNRQEQMFGDAVSRLNIVECDPRGENARPELCREAGVVSFPTWEINGQLYRGLRPLDELADLSGYQGPRAF